MREPGSFLADKDGKITGPNPKDEAMRKRAEKAPARPPRAKAVKEDDDVKD